MGPGQLSQVMTTVSKCASLHYCRRNNSPLTCIIIPPLRDPTKHSSLKDDIEEQSTALYATARLWDDGIIKPTDTRDTVGLALALSARERGRSGHSGQSQTTWDGDSKGYGIFRM